MHTDDLLFACPSLSLNIFVCVSLCIVFSAASGTDEDYNGFMHQRAPGGAPAKAKIPRFPLQYPNISLQSPSSFASHLLPAIRAIGDMIVPAIEKTGIQEEINDIIAALNETSYNPLFLLGFDDADSPMDTAWRPIWPNRGEKTHATTNRQQLQQPSTAGGGISSFFSTLWPDFSQSNARQQLLTRQPTRSSAAQGQQPHNQQQQQDSQSPQEEEEEEPLPWRNWNPEDLDLL